MELALLDGNTTELLVDADEDVILVGKLPQERLPRRSTTRLRAVNESSERDRTRSNSTEKKTRNQGAKLATKVQYIYCDLKGVSSERSVWDILRLGTEGIVTYEA